MAAITEGSATGANALAIGTNSQASGDSAVAVGINAKTNGNRAVAVGSGTSASKDDAAAFGSAAGVATQNSVAIGKSASVREATAGKLASAGVDVKTADTTTGSGSVAVGANSKAFGTNATAVGQSSNALGQNSFAGGQVAKAYGKSSVAVGNGAVATNDVAAAVGTSSRATAGGTGLYYSDGQLAATPAASVATHTNIAVGKDSAVNSAGLRNIAVGNGAATSHFGEDSISIGTNANNFKANGTKTDTPTRARQTIAVGKNAMTYGESSIALGNGAKTTNLKYNTSTASPAYTTANRAIAVGASSEASGESSAAIGVEATTERNDSMAIDKKAQVLADPSDNTAFAKTNNMAIGNNALIARHVGTSSLAVGHNAQALGADNQKMALGTNSVSSGTISSAVGVAAKAHGDTTSAYGSYTQGMGGFDSMAAGSSAAVVKGSGNIASSQAAIGSGSIGKSGLTRTLTKVAAGRINKDSTDAVNGSQLYLTQNALGNLGNSAVTVLGGDAEIKKDGDEAGTLTMSDIGGTGKNTVHDAIKASKTEVKAGSNIASVDKTTDNSDGHSVYTVNAKGTTVSAASDKVSVTSSAKSGNITDYAVDLSAAAKASLAKADSAVQNVVSAPPNLTAAKSGDTVTLNFSSTPTFDKVTTGNTVTDGNGVTISKAGASPVSLTSDGLNNGGNTNTITNVASDGDTDSNAANIGDVKKPPPRKTPYRQATAMSLSRRKPMQTATPTMLSNWPTKWRWARAKSRSTAQRAILPPQATSQRATPSPPERAQTPSPSTAAKRK